MRTMDKDLRNIADHFDRCSDTWARAYQEKTEVWNEYNTSIWREKYALGLVQNERLGTGIDMGCGTGHALIEMKRMGFKRVIGVEISDKMLSEAKGEIVKAGLADEIEFYKVDVQDMPMIGQESVDVCLALGVIEYQRRDEPLLRECWRILKPGAVAVIQMRNAECIWTRTTETMLKIVPPRQENIWYRQHRADEFRASASSCGFEVVREIYSHFHVLYPLDVYPFTIIPVYQNILSPIDNFLSKKLERLSGSRPARWLASMYIVKIRKV